MIKLHVSLYVSFGAHHNQTMYGEITIVPVQIIQYWEKPQNKPSILPVKGSIIDLMILYQLQRLYCGMR
jgi:hypothetical protein